MMVVAQSQEMFLFLTFCYLFHAHSSFSQRIMAHLVNEGGELVVEGLDLLPLLSPHSLDGGVDLQVERSQETLVDGDLLDASRRTDGEARATKAPSHSTPIAKSTADPKPTARPATKATSEVATTPTDRDPLGPP